MASTERGALSRADRGALLGFCIAGIAIAAYITVFSIIRILNLVSGTAIPVMVEFVNQPVKAPLGAGGAEITLALDRAVLNAPALPPIAIAAGIIGQILQIVTIVVVIGCLLLLARSILTGTVFSRRNTRLAMLAGLTGLVGYAAVQFFNNMLGNAAIASVTDNAVDNAVITVEPFTFILAAFVISIIGTTFVIGDRLQRDTEGLV